MVIHKDSARLNTHLLRLLPQAIAWSGIGYRSASTKYANSKDITTGMGSMKSGGRWNPLRSFPTVYLSCELDTAFKESFAHLSYFGFEPHMALPRTFAAVQLRLHRILDLTDGNVLKSLRVSRRSLLKQDWRRIQDGGREALSQAIGRLAQELGYEGILAPSAAAQRGTNLVYFPGSLLTTSRVKVLNPAQLPSRLSE